MNNDAIAAIQTSLPAKTTVVFAQRLGVWGPFGTTRSNPKVDQLITKAQDNRWVNGLIVITKTSHRVIW